MTQPITHFCQFTDEASAKAALPSYWSASNTGWDWLRYMVDGPIPIMQATGTFTTDPVSGARIPVMQAVPGYFLNVALPSLDTSLPGLTGAGYWPANGFTLVYGVAPKTPQRVFA